MNCRNLCATVCVGAVAGLVTAAASLSMAQPPKETKPAGVPEMKLPPGWTEADMMACVAAGTPGSMHEHLAKSVGVWQGRQTMWMAPDTEPSKSECTTTIAAIMDGRFTSGEMAGDIPGMGPFKGHGITGFDNVTQQFVSSWIDNHGTGIMQGTGELSPDGKTMTWKFTYNCTVTKKPAVMRQIERMTGNNQMEFEIFAADPKSGKEYKMLHIDYVKKS